MDNGDIQHKIRKYTVKLQKVKDIEQSEIYQRKISYYSKLSQSGGGIMDSINKRIAESKEHLKTIESALDVNIPGADKLQALKAKLDAIRGRYDGMVRDTLAMGSNVMELTNEINKMKGKKPNIQGLDDLQKITDDLDSDSDKFPQLTQSDFDTLIELEQSLNDFVTSAEIEFNSKADKKTLMAVDLAGLQKAVDVAKVLAAREANFKAQMVADINNTKAKLQAIRLTSDTSDSYKTSITTSFDRIVSQIIN